MEKIDFSHQTTEKINYHPAFGPTKPGIGDNVDILSFFTYLEELESKDINIKEFLEEIVQSLGKILDVDFVLLENIAISKKLESDKSIILNKISDKVRKIPIKEEISYIKLTLIYNSIYLLKTRITLKEKSLDLIIGNFNRPINFQQYLLFKKLTKFISIKVSKFLDKKMLKRNYYTDTLTGLYNRNFLEIAANIEIENSKRYKYPITVIMLDLDNFKKINDEKGHTEGDKILKQVGKIIYSSIRKGDIPIRYGGDEFIIFLLHTNIKNGISIAQKIKNRIENLKVCTKTNCCLSVSAGITEVKTDDDINTLINRVDYLLYKSKREGKNKITSEEGLT